LSAGRYNATLTRSAGQRVVPESGRGVPGRGPDEFRVYVREPLWAQNFALASRDETMACKPIDIVLQDAADLVEVRHTLRQIVTVKGD
jgi:hypothetical protein